MRQKKEITDRMMTSESWLKTLKLTRQLEEKEDMLTEKYKERKLKVEKEALEKMKSNPRYFYAFAKAQLEPWLTKMENFATLLLKRVNVSENNLNQSSRNQTLTL